MSNVYLVYLNESSTDDTNRWKVVCNDRESFFSDVVIDTFSETKSIWVESKLEYSFAFECVGYLDVYDNVAYISNVNKSTVIRKHILKTFSYRFLATSTTVLTAMYLGLSFELSALFGVGEILFKPMLYFVHERMWYTGKKSLKK
jgi:uncharacterized membrane protein